MKKLSHVIATTLAGMLVMCNVACDSERGDGPVGLSTESLTFPSGGGTETVSVTGTNWIPTADRTWIKVTTVEGGIEVTVDAWVDSNEGRSGSITIGNREESKTIAVRQTAAEKMTVDPAELSFKADESGVKTVTVTSATAWTVEPADPGDTWIHFTPAQGATTGTFEVSVDAYTGSGPRSGAIEIDNGFDTKTVTVTQRAPVGADKNIETVRIPAGTFQMGSPAMEPNRFMNEDQFYARHSQDFYMSKYEITNAQYATFLNEKGVRGEAVRHANFAEMTGGLCTWGDFAGKIMIFDGASSYLGNGETVNGGLNWDSAGGKWVPAPNCEDYAVTWVTYYGACEFARWAGGELPTEAQWEYACRGGAAEYLPFGIGTGSALISGMANFNVQAPYDFDKGGAYMDRGATRIYVTKPVGSYNYPNGYGLYDMHGNVSEWCRDMWYGTPNYPADTTEENPAVDYFVETEAGSGDASYVSRGGSWMDDAKNCRTAYRSMNYPGDAYYYHGFRIVFAAE